MPTIAEAIGQLQSDAIRGQFTDVVEAGKRHNATDASMIQAVHDHAMALGAVCPDPDGDDTGKATPPGITKESAEFTERAFSADQRKALSASGAAMADGSFPIENASDLANAVQAYGRSPDHATKAHIVKRAKALGATDKLPADWSGSTKESAQPVELTGDLVSLSEGAVRKDGTVSMKLVSPGWGSSGHYSADVLKRDGPGAFPKGTKSYWDHPTPTQEAERPERSLHDLAAELITDARWEDNGKTGPGLYADAKVFGSYKEAVNDLAPHIGVSIRATGSAKNGEAEGRKGRIIEAITAGKSVDFVTVPGRGGEIVSLFEAARPGHEPARKGPDPVELQEVQTALAESERKLSEANAQNARLNEALLLRDARDFATAELASIDLPPISRTRIAESLAREPIVKDGKIDQNAYRAKIKETAKSEMQYLETATGRGAIRGMGTAAPTSSDTQSMDRMARSFQDLGFSESAAKQAAAGRS